MVLPAAHVGRYKIGDVAISSTIGSTLIDIVCEDPLPEKAFFEHPHYLDLGPISRGAFGDVRRVRDTRSSRPLAMKVMRRCIARESRSYARFATEIEIMTSLQHPGILRVHGNGEFDDGRLWFIMPEVRGRTFAVMLDELNRLETHDLCRSLSFRHALRSLLQFCQIVAFAHEEGFLHRDLKPKNMMVADTDETFVIDWGVAKRLHLPLPTGSLAQRTRFTEQGEVLGTPAYMPPEQAFGDVSKQSPASDVYSLGAVLYHLLTGKPPYRGTQAAVIAQIKRAAPPPISAVVDAHRSPPKELVALCEAAMERAPVKRIAGTLRIAEGIGEWLDGAPDS